jgi:hypothetical protein
MSCWRKIKVASLFFAALISCAPGLRGDDDVELSAPEATGQPPELLEEPPEPIEEIVEYEASDIHSGDLAQVVQPYVACPTWGVWASADYLLWWSKGMEVPPLATSGITGVLGDTGTTVLYGDDQILDDARSGFRLTLGSWLPRSRRYGVEGDYWYLGESTTDFQAESDLGGSPRLFRPFFNVNPRLEDGTFDPPARADAELVALPDVLAGAVRVDAFSELTGAGIRIRQRTCSSASCASYVDACCRPHSVPRASRVDFLLGYRYLRLREGVSVRETLTSLLPPPDQGSFGIIDAFETANNFNGVDLGVMWGDTWGRWSLDLLGKLALGGMEQVVKISGQTTIANSEDSDGEYVGGLLSQRTNIGEYRRNVFGVVPELGVTLGYQLTCHWRVRVGYSLLYLSRVARPGEQIDLDVNPDLLAPEFTPFAGPERPEFVFRDTDFWAQGLNVGLECRW